MNKIPDIRGLYVPVQPTVKQSAERVTYQEFLPDAALQGIIYCYWQLRTSLPLDEPFVYRVVADGCIDIFFELNNPGESFVMGFCKKNFISVRLRQCIFPNQSINSN